MARKQSFSVQAPAAVVMIRPHHFTVNTETATDNSFQINVPLSEQLAPTAYNEITKAVEQLSAVGIGVHLYEDESKKTPDSVFPNNWFSTHAGGYIAIYPMKAPNRRLERRYDIIEDLKRNFRVQEVIDYSGLEPDGLFLEGTGAMVLDHIDRVAYAVKSDRTDPIALERFCTQFNFEPMTFDAVDKNNTPIYHTNVLMCIATEFVMIGLDMISNKARAQEIISRFEQSGRKIINLTSEQIHQFAGNAIELKGKDGRYLALSGTAYRSLTPDQIAIIEESATPIVLEIPTIEQAGGSVRCTIAGIHLSSRS
ncbi:MULTISPECIES: citrulline utilization hydrolase CtlX [unclassified Bartonella]|uniref:citrulline utilization hydrolase CtlX n=1 Tax=unclassified Bartonella TaxID=2645622 RepID=UPI0021C9894E|nr:MULTISPECIES: arginine deiminase-related protein [unclassified Bartonella]UXN02510.1 arginine deiminase-related protein [Bartonella sp. HY406]UXN05481.1 arginine deiminase-related protein [Bartonella sp. HY761]